MSNVTRGRRRARLKTWRGIRSDNLLTKAEDKGGITPLPDIRGQGEIASHRPNAEVGKVAKANIKPSESFRRWIRVNLG